MSDQQQTPNVQLTQEQYDELRFAGNVYVYRGEYPRHEATRPAAAAENKQGGADTPSFQRALNKVAAPV